MDSAYIAVQDFLYREIALLEADMELDPLFRAHLERESSPEMVQRALDKINYRRKIYCEKIFTEQTMRHCVLQIQEEAKTRVQDIREDVAANMKRLALQADPTVANAQTYNLASLNDDELMNLADSILEVKKMNKNSRTDLTSLENAHVLHKRSLKDLDRYKHILHVIESTLDADNLNNNLLKRSSELVKELSKLQSITTELESLVKKDPYRLKTILNNELPKKLNRNMDHILTGAMPDHA